MNGIDGEDGPEGFYGEAGDLGKQGQRGIIFREILLTWIILSIQIVFL